MAGLPSGLKQLHPALHGLKTSALLGTAARYLPCWGLSVSPFSGVGTEGRASCSAGRERRGRRLFVSSSAQPGPFSAAFLA